MATAATSRIFDSVFPPPSDVPVPTPTNTPLLQSSTTFGESLPQRPASSHEHPGPGVAEQIKWDRAWHTATTSLTLPNEPINISTTEGEDGLKKEWWGGVPDTETRKAVEFLLDRGKKLRKDDDLVRWYFEFQVVGHFAGVMRPVLENILTKKMEASKIESMVEGLLVIGKGLYLCQVIYMHPIRRYMERILPSFVVKRLQRDLHGLFVLRLPKDKVEAGLKQFFLHQASIILDVDRERYAPRFADHDSLSQEVVMREREKTHNWVTALQGVGLGGYQAQRIFGEVMNEMLNAYVKSAFSRKWESPSRSEQLLCSWIEQHYSLFIRQTLDSLQDFPATGQAVPSSVSRADIERWQEMAIRRLGALRSEELFDIVVEWDDDYEGAIQDLKVYVKDASSRGHLTSTFSHALSSRLLQPSAATSEILQVYISIIRVFNLLDPRGVLLDRIARPIRRYLREREDTVRIVVSGLLADPHQETSAEGALVGLAAEMTRHHTHDRSDKTNAELDFDDMEWMPDPIDAGPEYKKPKHSDVIGSLISLFESKDIFIKEFQNILGENLLKRELELEREVRVLELLKIRFGESALQACEVMLRDILDSRRLDAHIVKQRRLEDVFKYPVDFAWPLHARILSHLYWPSLHSDSFFIPPEVAELQEKYSQAFEKIKTSRKLDWLNVLGQATVKLELEDRTIFEEVQTWQASVIHAFQPRESEDASDLVIRNVPELMVDLDMPENLVLNALTFWVGKLVLKPLPSPPNPPRSYTVLETLADEAAAQEGTASAAIAAAAETVTATAAPAVLSEHEVAREKMGMYAQYVIGMLTNGGAMPLQQIVMMLKLTVPGGFPFGNEELKTFLESEVREGRLDFGGGAYKIKR